MASPGGQFVHNSHEPQRARIPIPGNPFAKWYTLIPIATWAEPRNISQPLGRFADVIRLYFLVLDVLGGGPYGPTL